MDVFRFYFVMELEKIVLLPIPTGWRDSNSPMGDGLSLLNGFLQNISLICAVTSTILKRTTYATYFGHFLLCEVKKIVLIPISMARWVSTVPWVMSYQPSMGCHKISQPEMTY